MPRLVALAIVVPLGLAACGQPPQGAQQAAYASDARSAETRIPSALAPPPAKISSAADFVAKAAAGDAFELAAAEAAQARAASAAVKGFAAMMVRDHTKSSADLKKAVAESGQALTASGSPSPDQQKALADLSGRSGPEFDKAYMQGQVQAHQAALALVQDYAQNGDVPALKAFAAESAAVVQTHLGQAKDLAAQLR